MVKVSMDISIDNRYCNRRNPFKRPILSLNHSGASKQVCQHPEWISGVAHERYGTLANMTPTTRNSIHLIPKSWANLTENWCCHKSSIWSLSINMNIPIDIAIGLITLKDRYKQTEDWPDCAVAGYKWQTVITGSQNGVMATRNKREKFIEICPYFAHRCICNEFFFSISYNIICCFSNKNLFGLSPLEALGASAIAMELVSLFTTRPCLTKTKLHLKNIHHKLFPQFDEI